jgi:glycosyltransferase involved in cell wall biosynthesis
MPDKNGLGGILERVSCLMVTKGPFEHFLRSLRSFCKQDYSDKELIVVTDGDSTYSAHIQDHIRNLGRQDVICVPLRTKQNLGALRNISLEHASGPLVCQWDDDDINHPRRLSIQIEAMKSVNAQASYLRDNFHLFCDTRKLYWCDWIRSTTCPAFPGSLLAYKDVILRYPDDFSRHEDSAVQEKLLAKTRTAMLSGYGYLYIYTFHGSNTFEHAHHAALARSLGFEAATLRELRSAIETWLSECEMDLPISVSDYLDNEVFRWTERKASVSSKDESAHRTLITLNAPHAT